MKPLTSSLTIYIVVLAAAIMIFAIGLLVFSLYKISKLKRRKPIEPVVRSEVSNQVKTDAILADLDVGIVAYGNDGRCLLSNKAASKILEVENLCSDLNSFLTTYCEENGVMARLVLGKSEATGIIHIGKKVVRITAKESRLEDKRKVATIFLLQDITQQELQEEKRKEFVANVSHELKTPLTTIITYSESLLDWGLKEKTIDSIRNDVKRMHDDARRMQNLVTDLLLLSSIDSKGIRIRMEQMDLNYAVRQAVERLQIQAAEKKIELSCTSVSILQPIFGDRASIDRIVSNLVSNAIKYSKPESEVKVYIGLVHDEAYVKVTDEGFGIDEKHLDKIFNRFYRVDGTGSRAFGGTGLGLSIVKELVDMHGGQISVKSGIAVGSTFTVMLPLARTLYNKVVDSYIAGAPIATALGQAVSEDLKRIAHEAGLAFEDWNELSAEELAEIKHKINEIPAEHDLSAGDMPVEA